MPSSDRKIVRPTVRVLVGREGELVEAPFPELTQNAKQSAVYRAV